MLQHCLCTQYIIIIRRFLVLVLIAECSGVVMVWLVDTTLAEVLAAHWVLSVANKLEITKTNACCSHLYDDETQ